MTISPRPSTVALSSRRSFSRCRVLVKLAEYRRPMLVNELAHACGMHASRLREVLVGGGDRFSRERSPVWLGLIQAVATEEGEAFALTAAGREEVAALRREAFWARGGRRGR